MKRPQADNIFAGLLVLEFGALVLESLPARRSGRRRNYLDYAGQSLIAD